MEKLSSNKLDYILFHLKQHVEIGQNWPILHLSPGTPIPKERKNLIIFPQSDKEVNIDKKIVFMRKSIPILFPLTDDDTLFHVDKNNNLIFHHDLLKSAFYLLSGYQETKEATLDTFNRFTYQHSIQNKTNSITLPVVNYYFEMIILGIEAYCKTHSFKLKRKRLFDNFGFFLSHDVDRVSFYHPREVAFKLKQILGLAPLTYSYRLTIALFIKGIFFLLSPFKKSDPWWNFSKIVEVEKKLGIRSTFFFLKKVHKNRDSRYQFNDKKIKQLIQSLSEEGFEVGLHGSFDSSDHPTMLKQQVDELTEVLGQRPTGIRQHFLRFTHPTTFSHQIKAGLSYDCTLSFAEHDGYRNSYCYPFKPYDFDKEQMLNIWEIPLVMMEVSVLNYRKASLNELKKSTDHHIEEAKKFGGIFSLLWHNCRMMDEEYPGIEKFYPELLQSIVKVNSDPVTGKEIVEKIKKLHLPSN